MAPIVVGGNTLGEIHRNYNYAVKSTVEANIEKIDYNDSDLDNLYKIDQAIRNRNIDYILETFKSTDMLYCSRAIKKSTWMINDPQYSHIMNPDYLFSKLFPEMISKARNKLLLEIRINLKDKERANEFFLRLKKIDIKAAVKWLPYCSEQFITDNLKNYINDIPLLVLMRLTEISLNFLHMYCVAKGDTFNGFTLHTAVKSSMKYASRDVAKYLDILDSLPENEIPILNSKTTKIIMKSFPDRIFDNLDRYSTIVDIKTFASFLKKTEIKSFIVKSIIDSKANYQLEANIKHFIMRIPEQERFEFVQEHFIDKSGQRKKHDDFQPVTSKLDNVYRWYTYAPFDNALNDLKQLIRLESNANERHCMISIMIDCAGNNVQNIHSLLQYYKVHHMNEAFKFKSNFINTLLDKTNPCNFYKNSWSILQEIFMSMEVYSESEHNLQSCIRWIILYNIIHSQAIPEVILSKFIFSTFKKEQIKLKDNEREKVFKFLLSFTREGLNKFVKENYQDVHGALIWANNMLNLLRDWHQDLKNYPDLIETIKAISYVPKEKRMSAIFDNIYNKSKSWRKYLLKESILLSPSESTCINALKHNPELLHPNREEIKDLSLSGKISLKHFLQKLRIYKPHLALEFEEMYCESLEQGSGLKSSIIGLCLILPLGKLSSLFMKYVPNENKINWNNIDERKLNVQKHIAGNMHAARPQPSITIILSYAQGDYLQYALAPLNSVVYNISVAEFQKILLNLIDAPVSLQKHVIRGAFMKCQIDELVNVMPSIWETNKNSSIRATIFRLTFNLLCRETESESIESLWCIMNGFIDSLAVEENKIIFVTFCHVHKVPIQVRPAFCMKSYAFVKQLPEKFCGKDILYRIVTCTKDIMELMDPGFMVEILMESVEENFGQYIDVISAFLLSTQDEKSQIYRYEKVLLPLFSNTEGIWKLEKDNLKKVNFKCLLNTLIRDVENIVIKKDMMMPIPLFRLILDKLNELNFKENYTLVTSRKLALDFIVVLDACLKDNENDNEPNLEIVDTKSASDLKDHTYVTAIRKFSKICLNHIVSDIHKYGTSVVLAFKTALNEVLDNFNFCDAKMKLELCEEILNDTDTKEGFLLALLMIPERQYYMDGNKHMELLKTISSHSDSEVKILCSIFKNDLNLLF